MRIYTQNMNSFFVYYELPQRALSVSTPVDESVSFKPKVIERLQHVNLLFIFKMFH